MILNLRGKLRHVEEKGLPFSELKVRIVKDLMPIIQDLEEEYGERLKTSVFTKLLSALTSNDFDALKNYIQESHGA